MFKGQLVWGNSFLNLCARKHNQNLGAAAVERSRVLVVVWEVRGSNLCWSIFGLFCYLSLFAKQEAVVTVLRQRNIWEEFSLSLCNIRGCFNCFATKTLRRKMDAKKRIVSFEFHHKKMWENVGIFNNIMYAKK